MKLGGGPKISDADQAIGLVILGGIGLVGSCFIPSQSYLYLNRVIRGLGLVLLTFGIIIYLRDLRDAYREVKDAEKKTVEDKDKLVL